MGFLSPGEIASRVRALDIAIQSLDAQISISKEARVNEAFKESWKSFVSRWQIDRDNWLGSTWSRMFASQIAPRLDDFQLAYQRWLENYQKRIPGTARVPKAIPETYFGLQGLSIQTVILLAGLAIGGYWIVARRKKQ